MELKARARPGESGQAITEYLLLLLIVVSAYLMLAAGMARSGITEKLMKPLKEDFARAYRYGHPKAKGYEDGEPQKHPRIPSAEGKDNFRIFMSPGMR